MHFPTTLNHNAMPTLQVRDLPEDVYLQLKERARRENRSISQQTISILQEYLEINPSPKSRRKEVLETIDQFEIPSETANSIDSVSWIREDRER